MIGNLEPEENVLSEEITHIPCSLIKEISDTITELGWEAGDIEVKTGGTWKKDKFIVLSNTTLNPRPQSTTT
jgi:major membrane immunogen (membrane-anchored lipoprotein)|tara:strand:+ start:1431 stop:1646 length:216 start_codon:yes stop_codon:yes gene_type:complete